MKRIRSFPVSRQIAIVLINACAIGWLAYMIATPAGQTAYSPLLESIPQAAQEESPSGGEAGEMAPPAQAEPDEPLAIVPTPTPRTEPTPEASSTPVSTPEPSSSFSISIPANEKDSSRKVQPAPLTEARIQVREAEYYQRNGDYPSAASGFEAVVSKYPHSLEARDALLGLAQTNFLKGEYKAAIESLDKFLEVFPSDEHVNQAIFFIATNYSRLENWSKAIAYYELYLDRKAEPLAAYASLYAGDAYFQAGLYAKAVQHLKNAVAADMPRIPTIDATEKTADSYFRLGLYQPAIDWYQKVLARARVDSYKADIGFRLGRAYAALGDAGQAKDAWQDVIENYPTTKSALSAVENVPVGNPPTYYHRGLVYYHNDLFESAIAAFDKYIADHPDGEYVAKARYYRALAYRYKGDVNRAISELNEVARLYVREGVSGEAMWQLGRVLESSSRYAEAVQQYAYVATYFPNEDYAQDALFRQGLCYYKQSDFRRAKETWDKLLRTYPSTESTARALFWVGKALGEKLGDPKTGQMYLNQVALAESWDYYGVRAKHLTRNDRGLAPNKTQYDRQNLLTEWAEEKNAFESWLATWSGQDSYSYEPDNLMLRKDPAFRRVEEMVKVGLRKEIKEEYWGLWGKYQSDPVATYELSAFYRQNGLYHLSMATASDLVAMSPTGKLHDVPKFLQKLAYPVYFAEVLISEAEKTGVEPLLLAAVIRQESRWDQFAESEAKARGLTQVMPATGKAIAQNMALKDFRVEELFKPYISIAAGAYYLAEHLRNLNNDLYLTLAAYNGGAGNVLKWTDSSTTVDPDVFVEDIGFGETRYYVKSVYQQYDLYRQIYGP